MRQSSLNLRGLGYIAGSAAVLAGFRGSAIATTVTTSDGTILACTTAAAEGDELTSIPDADRNAAEADNRVFAFSLSVGQGVVGENDVLTWNQIPYRVTRAYPTAAGLTWRAVTFRVGRAGISKTNPTNSNNAWGPS